MNPIWLLWAGGAVVVAAAIAVVSAAWVVLAGMRDVRRRAGR